VAAYFRSEQSVEEVDTDIIFLKVMMNVVVYCFQPLCARNRRTMIRVTVYARTRVVAMGRRWILTVSR